MKPSARHFSVFILLAFLFGGCTFVRVQNVASSGARVQVALPDGTVASKEVPSGAVVDFVSSNGGAYTVSLVASEDYRALLEQMRDDITTRLFEEGGVLSAVEVAQLVERLEQVDTLLAQLAEPGAGCGGSVPDFETAVVTLSYDDFASKWVAECSSPGG